MTEIDFTNLDSTKLYAFKICKNFLNNKWSEVNLDDFEIEKMKGSLENFVFKCKLKTDFVEKNFSEQPRQIVFKINSEAKRKKIEFIFKDNLTSSLIGNQGIGPKVYGIFELGRIEEFIPCSTIDQNEMILPSRSIQVAKALAKFHRLEMPFLKDINSFYSEIKTNLKELMSIQFKDTTNVEFQKKILGYNLENELEQLIKIIESLNSPIVFCHNDVWCNNILKLNEDSLMLIDYEDACYNYRGNDFGGYFGTWMFTFNNEFPFFKYNENGFPNLNDLKSFIDAYIDEYKKQSDDFFSNKLDVNQLLNEIKVFSLLNNLIYAFWGVSKIENSKKSFGYKEYATDRLNAYYRLKNIFFSDNFINFELLAKRSQTGRNDQVASSETSEDNEYAQKELKEV